jgi:hypothetical protein
MFATVFSAFFKFVITHIYRSLTPLGINTMTPAANQAGGNSSNTAEVIRDIRRRK